MNKRAVTIIELGVVILIIGLMSIALSPFMKIIRAKACQMRCINNLQKLSLAIREYALGNDGKPPSDLSLIYIQGYVGSENVFDCPFSPYVGNAKEPDYIYVKEFDFKSSENPAIIYDKKDNHKDGTINILYLNGEIETEEVDIDEGTMAE